MDTDKSPISETLVLRPYDADRELLRPFFLLAEDSSALLDTYITDGVVLVAEHEGAVVGHLQLVKARKGRAAEIKNMAVAEQWQGLGIGRALVSAAREVARRDGQVRVVVATAAADIGNLRFYQRQGFRMLSVERDAFTESAGYPPGTEIDGIELRDRVWLDQDL